MNEEKLKKDYQHIGKNLMDKIDKIIKNGNIGDEKNKKTIKDLLSKTDYNYANMIAEFVCALCNVDRANMLSKDKTPTNIQARAIWWSILHNTLKLSYREISILSQLEDTVWDVSAICNATSRLTIELKGNPFLDNKYNQIRRMVQLTHNPEAYSNPFSDAIGLKVRLIKPKQISVDIEDE